MPEAWDTAGFDRIVERAALHYPLRVFWQGRELERRDWLAGAYHVETWETGRIAVFRNTRSLSGVPTVNFHGVTLACPLPWVDEIDGPTWTARYDVGEASPIQLVLPARKEVVRNPAHKALRDACHKAIFRAIAAEPSHRLAHKDWQCASALNIPLGEAAPWLNAWVPSVADRNNCDHGEQLRDTRMVIIDTFDADLAQSAARAFGDGAGLAGRLVEAEPRLAGYGWYDHLPHITDLRFSLRDGETRFSHSEFLPLEAHPTGRIDAISLEPVFADQRSAPSFPTDLLVIKDPHGCDDLSDTAIILTHETAIDVAGLADFLEGAVFCPSDDSDSDRWETQRDDFRAEARRVAADLLLGEEEATLHQIRDALRTSWWLIPEGRTIAVTMSRDAIDLDFVPAPARPETG